MKPTVQSIVPMFHRGVPLIEIAKPFCKIRTRKARSMKKWRKYSARYIPQWLNDELLAANMVSIVARPLNYAEIGRKLFYVEELPQGAYGNNVFGLMDKKEICGSGITI
jgi:hypothetical protein